MLAPALVLLSLLGGKPGGGCFERCSSEMARCNSPCGSNQQCMDKCNRHSQSCSDVCAAELAKEDQSQKKKKMGKTPCGIEEKTNRPIPCTADQEAQMKNPPKELKDLCRDAEGNITACPGQMDQIKEKMKKLGMEIGCKDSNGMPVDCPAKK